MKIVKIVILIIVLFFSVCISACEKCNHKFETIKVVEANCEHGGYKLQVCNKCNKQIKTDVILKTGHSFSAWQVVEAATPEKDGIEKRICDVCYTIEERVVSSFNYIDSIESNEMEEMSFEEKIDLIVLAGYLAIVSEKLINLYPNILLKFIYTKYNKK